MGASCQRGKQARPGENPPKKVVLSEFAVNFVFCLSFMMLFFWLICFLNLGVLG